MNEIFIKASIILFLLVPIFFTSSVVVGTREGTDCLKYKKHAFMFGILLWSFILCCFGAVVTW